MHRSNRSLILLVLFVPVPLGTGCRHPFSDNQIQVQPVAGGVPSTTDAPRARLGGGLGSRSSGTADATAATGDIRSSTAALSAQTPQASGVSMTLGDQQQASPAGSQTLVEAPLTQEEERMIEEAYAKASPEIRALARRQLASLKLAEANRTSAQSTANKPPASQSDDSEKLPSLPSPAESPTGASAEASGVQLTAATRESATTKPEEFTMPIPPAPAETNKPAEANAAAGATQVADAEKSSDGDKPAEATPATDAPPAAEPPAETLADASATEPKVTSPPADGDPQATVAGLSDKQLLDALMGRYQSRLDEAGEEAADDLSDVIALRTLRLISGAPDEAVKPVEGWTTSEQEFLNYQMLALWQMLDPKSHPVRARRWATALPELKQATSHLAAATGALEVRNLAFCTSVLDYGQIEPFKSNRFKPGQLVLLYVEIENFMAERLSDGYETHVQGMYEILDAEGKRVAQQVLAPYRETNNNYRRDYYVPYEMYLPELSAGNYRMQITMEDVKGKTYGQSSIPFEIAN